MAKWLSSLSGSAAVILCLAIMLIAGFLMTRLTKKCKLPNVTGYIFAGIILGPYLLGAIPQQTIANMSFVTDIALSFIAFGVGRYFKLEALKRSGKQVLIVTLFESLLAGVVITLAMIFIFRLPVSFSLLLGAIGCATAPASTIMTIRQYHAKGPFVDMILQVVALDDAVALIAFSICTAVVQVLDGGGHIDPSVFLLPVLTNIAAILAGGAMGWLLHHCITERRSQDHKLVLVCAMILGLSGLCAALDVSPLLSCMAMGTVYINVSGNKNLFKQVNSFTPPILLLFFVLSGLNLNVPILLTAGITGVGYFFVRILGKYAGAWLGAAVSHASSNIRNYLGLALIPQAGVSIGLAVLGQRLLPGKYGTLLSTIILSSAVLYETVGPACAKASLFLSHTITRQQAEEQDAQAAAIQQEHRRPELPLAARPAVQPIPIAHQHHRP
ncbi:cation:proton antiporter [Neobittarella massiliensis]|uniref:cation:proton antiporter n=1 Tax=Neobittarella massiliensis (ex Bilen et al. 2018) TaxID=2041842 RepID=UPI000CF6B442|nr:cation:proton antiporter [Neobittarella massiliensis]